MHGLEQGLRDTLLHRAILGRGDFDSLNTRLATELHPAGIDGPPRSEWKSERSGSFTFKGQNLYWDQSWVGIFIANSFCFLI